MAFKRSSEVNSASGKVDEPLTNVRALSEAGIAVTLPLGEPGVERRPAFLLVGRAAPGS
jgi:hypothetical protein